MAEEIHRDIGSGIDDDGETAEYSLAMARIEGTRDSETAGLGSEMIRSAGKDRTIFGP